MGPRATVGGHGSARISGSSSGNPVADVGGDGFGAAVTSVERLRELYREPSRPAVAKEIDRLDANCVAFVEHSPFVVLSTAHDEGRCDTSPRGGDTPRIAGDDPEP